MVSRIWFAGRASSDFGICVEHCPSFCTGSIEYEKITVPGRNGDLIAKGTRKLLNYTQSYDIWFSGKSKNTMLDAKEIAAWLLSNDGYARLEDTYDPYAYRMALFSGPFDVENWMLKRGRATLAFDCKPQRWIKSGEQPIVVQSGQKIRNNWQPSLPLIRVSGTGAGTLVVGESTISITGMTGEIIIDSDTQDAYSGTKNLNNNIVVQGGFPVFGNGDTVVSYSGGITAVEITPRWWTL